ncbi:MAG: HAMP domain-containing sensor histidine kinase [Sphingobium sp.]
MIEPLKQWLKRHWPPIRLRAILFGVLLFVAALPGVAAVFLRVYENTLVQQTETELIAQAAALAGAYRATWPEPIAKEPRPLRIERPRVDLNAMPILPVMHAPIVAGRSDPRAAIAGRRLKPVVEDTVQTTLASIRVLDRRGVVVLGRTDLGRSYAQVPEVKAALGGRSMTVLRRRGGYEARYAAEALSRASAIRVHYVRPVIANGQVIGGLMLSRSPRGLFLGIYQDRGKILFGMSAIFVTLLFLAALLSRAIARPIEALSRATESVARGAVEVPETPATAAVEIRTLYENFALMAERIEARSRYLRDFAAAVSHEFKTPIAGLRGALELLGDHGAEMTEAERTRFLSNAMADAYRLSHLVQRLLDLARADMTVMSNDAATGLAGPARRVADAHRGDGLAIDIAIPGDLPAAAVPSEVIEAVLETLVENSRQAEAVRIGISARVDEGGLLLSVADNGRGVPAADHERIFEPFHTGRRSEGGSGLGLAIARSLLAASGGGIRSMRVEIGALIEIRLRRA